MKQYRYTIDQADYDVTIRSIQGQKATVEVNGIAFEVEMHGSQLTEASLPDAAPVSAAPVSEAPKAAAPEPAAAPAPAGAAGEGTPVKAPLPGVVTKVNVAVGQAVKKGEAVLVLEAMKMENNIAAEQDGTVTGVCVKAGDSVLEGAVLLTIG
ncbi:MAG: biotin/lipoyl-binding protein [Alloprevotella sp.]|nr:biotin/lipoyl-binding protein [Alloprevotella sp.]